MTRGLRLLYVRYFLASAIALAADFACFSLFVDGGLAPTPAAGMGYVIGTAVHWLVSSRAVFSDRLAGAGAPRVQQQGLFLASSLAGLGLTMAVVAAGTALGLDPRLAKGAAIIVSFQATYLLRRHVVFGR